MHRIAPHVPAQQLWEMATIRAARAILQDSKLGSLTPGKYADVIAFDVQGSDPLAFILETHGLPCRVWIDGDPVAQ